MVRFAADDARTQVDLALKQVEVTGEPVAFEREGRAIAFLVPAPEYRRLRRLLRAAEDREDVAEAARRLADPAERPIPYGRARKRLGLA
jgi:PHD/YefM family antitoxin component YafN of YafNO toxin-antitoxin module